MIGNLPRDALAEILGRVDWGEIRQKDLVLVCQNWKNLLESGRINCGTNLSQLSLTNICKVRYLLSDKNWSTNPAHVYKLSEEFIDYFAADVVWKIVINYQKLSEVFIRRHMNILRRYQSTIFACHELSEQFIDEFATRRDWSHISCSVSHLSEEFLEKNISLVDWLMLSHADTLSIKFVCTHADKIDWISMAEKYYLSEEVLKVAAPYIDIRLAREFMRERRDLYERYLSQFIGYAR